MSQKSNQADLIVYLKYMNNDLYYCLNDPDGTYKPLDEDTTFGVGSGWVVEWNCADGSIEKINNIVVNETKAGTSRNWKDIWAVKPKKVNTAETIFQGTVKTGVPAPQEFNGYTIHYKTADGDKKKDPLLKQPQEP